MNTDFKVNDQVIMKKPHACKENLWTITRVGVDVKIRCNKCNHEVMLDRLEFLRKLKKVIPNEKN